MNVLAVGCHPDDLEIGCGGTIIKYARQGHKVFYCNVASGSMGHVVIMPDELVEIRRAETEASCSKLGAEHISLDTPDIEVDSKNQNLTDKMIDVIRFTKPDVIITHSPDDYMRDHVEVSRLVFDASFSSSLPHKFTQNGRYEKIAPIYYMDTLAGLKFQPTEYVDVTDTIETKLEALECHESQIKWMLDHDKIDFIDFVRTCSKYRGLQCGVPYAEGFMRCLTWPRGVPGTLLP